MFHLNRVFILCMCLYIFSLVVMFDLNLCVSQFETRMLFYFLKYNFF